MSRWVRLWDDMPTDPKWRAVARRSNRPISEVIAVFVFMMTSANATSGALEDWDDEDVAAALDIDVEAVASIRAAMDGKVIENNHLSGWDKRQPKRQDDLSTDRVRAFRERKRAEETDVKRDETQRNAPDTETETEKNIRVRPSARDELEAVLSPDTAAAVIEHRGKLKSPLTAVAAKRLATKLAAWPDPEEAAATMLARGWKGFEPDWMPKQPDKPPDSYPFPLPAWKAGRVG